MAKIYHFWMGVPHFGTNDVQKYSVDVITCKFRNLIYSVRRKNPDISILISSVLPRPTDFHILGEKVVAINNRLVRICKEEKVQFIKSFRRFCVTVFSFHQCILS